MSLASTLSNLALLASTMDDHETALRRLAEVDRIRRMHYPPDHPLIAVHELPAAERSDTGRVHHLAVVLAPGGRLSCIDIGTEALVTRMVSGHRRRMGGASNPFDAAVAAADPDATADAADLLTSRLGAPIRDASGPVERLYIVPDGDLCRLLWASVPDRAGRSLVETVELVHLVSGRDLLRPVEPVPSGAPVVIGDPDFDLAPGPARSPHPDRLRDLVQAGPLARFGALPGARDEAVAVAAVLGTEPLTGAAALKSTVLALRSPRVLHLATHGFFLGSRIVAATSGVREDSGVDADRERFARANPMLLVGLALAGANTWMAGGDPSDTAGNGFLTAEEVLAVDLDGTKVVVLSACDTGLGALHVAEGPMSLRRAFLLAGATAVVAALWRIPDDKTRHVMALLHDRLAAGITPARALRAAQLEYRRYRPGSPAWSAFDVYARPLSGG